MLRKIFFYGHFLLLLIITINISVKNIFNFQLQESLFSILKIVFVITGVAIAIMYFRKLAWKRFYFNLFPIMLLTYLLAYIIRGFLGGVIMATLSYFIVADKVTYEKDDVTIYLKYTGPFDICCVYKIAESKFVIFEKNYSIFKIIHEEKPQIVNVTNTEKTLKVVYKDLLYNEFSDEMELKNKILLFKKAK